MKYLQVVEMLEKKNNRVMYLDQLLTQSSESSSFVCTEYNKLIDSMDNISMQKKLGERLNHKILE